MMILRFFENRAPGAWLTWYGWGSSLPRCSSLLVWRCDTGQFLAKSPGISQLKQWRWDTGFRGRKNSAWSREHIGWLLFAVSFFLSSRPTQERDAIRMGMEVSDDVLEGSSLNESAKRRVPKGYKTNGSRPEVSVWIWCSTRDDQEEEETRCLFVIMAFVREQSCKCTKSELALFSVPPTQTSMEKGS